MKKKIDNLSNEEKKELLDRLKNQISSLKYLKKFYGGSALLGEAYIILKEYNNVINDTINTHDKNIITVGSLFVLHQLLYYTVLNVGEDYLESKKLKINKKNIN